MIQISNDTAAKVREGLLTNSTIGIDLGSTKVYLIKKKLSKKSEEEKHFNYSYTVMLSKNGTSVFNEVFRDREIEYARDTAISFFLTIVKTNLQEVLDQDNIDLDKMVCA